MELYLRLKGSNKDKVFHRGAERNIQSVIDVLGDRPVDEYASSDAVSYRDYLLKKGLTTKGSQRQIPLVGASLWAAQRIKANPHHIFAFPRYNTTSSTNGNSASAAINKWLKPRVPEGCVIHSFRHSFRDRLRAVQCPSDIIDQIGGWSTAGVGQAYGEGYSLDRKQDWLQSITIPIY